MKVIALRNILIDGRHVAALTEVEVDEATAKALIAQRVVALPKPAGVSAVRQIETATHAAPVAQVATSVAARPKSPMRKAAQ